MPIPLPKAKVAKGKGQSYRASMPRIALHTVTSNFGVRHTLNLYQVVRLETFTNYAMIHLTSGDPIQMSVEGAKEFATRWEAEEASQGSAK